MADPKKPEPVKPPPMQTVGQESMEDAVRSAKQEKRQQAMEKDIYGAPVQPVKKAKGGTASARADGIAQRGKTRGKIC